MKERKQPPVVTPQQVVFFLQYIYFVVMAKNHQKFWPGCLVHEFSFTDIFERH